MCFSADPPPCLLGDRGLMGPPGDKPHIPRQIIADMKGTKGEDGHLGDPGFTGARGRSLWIRPPTFDP